MNEPESSQPISGHGDRFADRSLEDVRRELTSLHESLIAAQSSPHAQLDEIHPAYRESARNLLGYLALRRRDLRPLQMRLAALGLSSLGRAESHVVATVEAILGMLHRLSGREEPLPERGGKAIDFAGGERLLLEHTETLLGQPSAGRSVRIMVTMPSEAADDYTLVHDLLEQGMDCARINCAHDDAGAWSRMIEHVRRAESAVGRSCRVVMDLAGPKLRTGPLEPGPAVVRVRAQKDVYGRVTHPGRIWLTAGSSPLPAPSTADACLEVAAEWLGRLRVGDEIGLVDARGSKRTLSVVDTLDRGCWAETRKTAYLVPGTVLCHRSKTSDDRAETPVSGVPPTENALLLRPGDQLVLTRDLSPGRPATYDSAGRVLTPATVGCTIPEVLEDVRSGEHVWFDDGKIGGVIERVEPSRVLVRVQHARLRGQKLGSDKGINLPESSLRLAAITSRDLEDLAFVAANADVIELSFANRVEDVNLLQEHLSRTGSRRPGIVLKIETRRGFESLPAMLLAAMRWPSCGVMIARGDLAVECGFERLAEVQEEILWICEAAHVPVVWATQVLETLAREGMPSRAEITDAAMGHRAECVMLNKGPHVVTAVRVLDDILRRMEAHQAKKRAMLRELRLAHSRPAP